MNHVVSFSGGLGSWAAAKRVAEKHGTDNLYLVFADVLMEDDDLYRFLPEAAADVGGELVILSDGRDPYDVFSDKRYMGNTRTAHCSEELKNKPFYAWVDSLVEEKGPATVYLGIDWSESHRLPMARKRRPEYVIEAPMCDAPYLTASDVKAMLKQAGIELPSMYKLGFAHNNCGGCCVKAGQGQWAQVLDVMPDRYAEHEAKQEKLMAEVPTARPFLRMTVDGELKYLSLKEFRHHLELNKQIDMFDVGGCGCFLD
jgi:3'-phosphoadenosine 5'-phosphosulfate sulfotransferase (PAPS reductase)/FAD synthetase